MSSLVLIQLRSCLNKKLELIPFLSWRKISVQAVRLESARSDRVRYMVVVYTSGRQDTEENILLGIDFNNKEGYKEAHLKRPTLIKVVFLVLNTIL